MEEQTKIEETVDSIKDYLNTRYELAILKASDKLAHIASNIGSFIPIIFLTVLSILLLSFALAFYLNKVLMSEFQGFIIVGSSYLLIVCILAAMRKNSIAKPMRNKIIKELFKNHNTHKA